MTGFAPDVRDRLAALGRVRALRRGERLIHEGLASGGVILVLQGTLRVTRVIGGEEVVLAIRGPGDLLGELGPISSGTAHATVEAREPGRVVVMPASRFVAAQQADAELAAAVVSRLVELLVETDRRLVNARCKPLRSRVAEEILLLVPEPSSGPGSGTGTATGPGADEVLVTQSELASLCVGSRSNVAKAVGDLRDEGLVETRRGRIRIVDHEGLRLVADTVGDPD